MKLVHAEKYRRLGLRIAYYRKIKGLTQEQLAEALSLSAGHIAQVEAPNMDKAVSLDTLFDIADILEVPPYKLFDFDD